jgi:hypothetical protein
MPKEIQALASDRHANVARLNRSLLLWDKAMGAMLKLYRVSFQLDDDGYFRFVLDKHD